MTTKTIKCEFFAVMPDHRENGLVSVGLYDNRFPKKVWPGTDKPIGVIRIAAKSVGFYSSRQAVIHLVGGREVQIQRRNARRAA